MSDKDSFVFTGTQEVRRPGGSIPPHGRFTEKNGTLWVHMRPVKLENQNTKGQGGSMSIGSKNNPTFVFLASDSLAETVSHEWEAYESVQSRLAEKVRSVAKTIGETEALASSFSTKTFKSLASSQGINDFMNKTLSEVKGSNISKIKIDTPLVYTNSKRRDWSFTFNLVAENSSEPSRDIIDVVQDLMKYSSPEMTGGIHINLPYIFSLTTKPVDFIKATHVALESVQPTYKGPYIKGYPSMCELQLTFKDLSPLFRSTIQKGTIINVKS